MGGTIHIVLTAAGASRRMQGRDKLLENLWGLPILRRQALAMLAACVGPVAVTLRAPDPERAAVLTGLDLTHLPVPDASEGMSASLRAAAIWARGNPLMVVPADMPEISSDDIRTLARAYRGRALRATDQHGTPGHPVMFPPESLLEFAALQGDQGARGILANHPPQAVMLPKTHALTDLDTPADWQRYRAFFVQKYPGGEAQSAEGAEPPRDGSAHHVEG